MFSNMAFVSVPKDLSRVKTKVVLNLTKRQLICFGTAAIVGVPSYIFTRAAIGNTASALLMIGIMLPAFLIAMYEKDGMPAEKVLRNYIRTKMYWPGIRPYKTENLYEVLEEEAKNLAIRTHRRAERETSGQLENKTAATAPVGKRQAGKGKQSGREKSSVRQQKQ